jgi:hypothetical protein
MQNSRVLSPVRSSPIRFIHKFEHGIDDRATG